MKGFGSALVSRTKRLMAALRSSTDRKTPRISRLLVSIEDIEGSKQRRGTVALVVMRHRDGAARFHRQARTA